MEEKDWVTKYYRELDREKRQEILEQAIAEEGMNPATEVRKKLLEQRYEKTKKQKTEIDCFIRAWMTLAYTKNIGGGPFSRKKLLKDRENILKDWNFALARQYGEEGERALYQELHNMTELYLSLCLEDRSYSSMILGIGRMSKDSLIAKIAREVYTMAYEIPGELGMEEELQLFTKAATDVYYEMFPKNRDLLELKIHGVVK